MFCVGSSMKWSEELSNLLITASGTLILLAEKEPDPDFEILGISETEGDLNFKLRKWQTCNNEPLEIENLENLSIETAS